MINLNRMNDCVKDSPECVSLIKEVVRLHSDVSYVLVGVGLSGTVNRVTIVGASINTKELSSLSTKYIPQDMLMSDDGVTLINARSVMNDDLKEEIELGIITDILPLLREEGVV